MINRIAPMKHMCSNKILPLVYDDSLSYYESVCKLTDKVNELINEINDNLEDYIRVQLDKLFINAIYDEANENLILRLEMRE